MIATASETYYSALELKGLPGMPQSVKGIWNLGEKGKITRQNKTAGYGYEYALSSLPEKTYKFITQREEREKLKGQPTGECPLETADHSHLWSYYDSKPDKAKQEAQRKLQALHAARALIQSGQPKMTAYTVIAAQQGEHWQTICRWFARVKDLPREHWLPALLDGYTGRMKTAEVSLDAWDSFKADYLRRERPTEKACFDRLKRAAKKQGWTIPSLKTLMRKLHKEIHPDLIILKRHGEDAYKKTNLPQERDHSVFHALEAVNGDGYTFFKYVRFESGEVCRPTVWIWQDIFSSRALAARLDVSENKDMIRLSIGDLIDNEGIPRHFWIDNTRAAANKDVTGGAKNRYRFTINPDEPLGLIPLIGAQVHWATPGHGQAKPVERMFGIGGIGEYVDKHPAFAGRGTMKTPIPIEEFEPAVRSELANWNARLGRRGRGMNGRSFDQVYNESYSSSVIRKGTAEQRALWLLAPAPVTCNRNDGSFTILENRYWCEAMAFHKAQKVVARFDPQNMHSSVLVYTLDGRKIGAAQCIAAVGFNDREAAREVAKQNNRKRKAIKQIAEAELRITAREAAKNLPECLPTEPKAQSKVIEGVFKKAVGSDIQPHDHHDSFARAVAMMKEADQQRIRL